MPPMTPLSSAALAAKAVLASSMSTEPTPLLLASKAKPDPYPWKVVWRNVFLFVYLHYASARGFYLILSGQVHFYTVLWAVLLVEIGIVGVTAGSHRLWSHRSYKGTWQLRTLLMLMQTLAFQNHIYEWSRDHRVHHKFTDTDADPHNAKRGFFFSHMGWLLIRKHPDVRSKGAGVDLSDLERDPIVMFQKKYYLIMMPLIAFVMPAVVPVKLWGESAWTAWYVCSMARYATGLHITWLINSAAHMWGTRPIDKNISPAENVFMGPLALGEGWHNYHHVFPWDYKAAELGKGNYVGNLTAAVIDFFSLIGWAYDLKTVPKDMVAKRVRRTGDGSHPYAQQTRAPHDDGHHDHDDEVWGWGDTDMSQEDICGATIINKAE